MDPDFLHAINGDWDALLSAMRESRSLVHRTDSSGMSILHWICLHQDIPTDVVVKVVFANPHAVHLRNDAGHLPIDLALQAECGERILEVLRAAASSSNHHRERAHEQQPELPSEFSNFHSESDGYDRDQRQHPHHAPYHQQHQHQQRQPHHQQQQQHVPPPPPPPPTSHYYEPSPHEQQRRTDNYSAYGEEPQYQQLIMYGLHQQQQQQQPQPQPHERSRSDSYHGGNGMYPEDDGNNSDNDQDDHRYAVRPPPQPQHVRKPLPHQNSEPNGLISIYSNQPVDERERVRSLSSAGGFNPMLLTEQRLQQREHDLISYATEHDLVLDPSSALTAADMNSILRPPQALDAWRQSDRKTPDGDSSKKPRPQSSFPPRWKQSRNCHVCMTHFTLMKRRHHCRNCGQSVCGAHSTNRVALPKFALLDPQRLCDKCFLMGHFIAPSALPPGSGSFGVESIGSVPSSHPSSRHTYAPPSQQQRTYTAR